MKRLIVLAIVATMAMGLAVSASAAVDAEWIINIAAGGPTGVFGTKATFSDALGSATEDGTPPPSTPVGTAFMASKIGEVGGYLKDGRKSFTGAPIIWDLTLTKVGADQTGTANVSIWNLANTAFVTTNDFAPLSNETIKLYQVIGGQRAAVALWTADGSTNAVTNLGSFAIGSQFQLVATAVPEPGSIVAMFSGLVGLAGFGIRRRK